MSGNNYGVIQPVFVSSILFVKGICLNLVECVSSGFRDMFIWSFYYMRKFPDLCFSSQILHVEPPTVYADTLLRAVHQTLQDVRYLPVVVQLVLEVIFTTAVYDPVNRICTTGFFRLLRLLPGSIERYLLGYRIGNVPLLIYLVSTLTRCILVGLMRDLWEAHYNTFDFPDPNALVEKSVILIFVKFFLGAPASLICIYWTLVIAYQYIFKFHRKTYEDLLLLSLLSLIYVAIMEWIEGFYALSLTYLFTSYMIYFYWLLS